MAWISVALKFLTGNKLHAISIAGGVVLIGLAFLYGRGEGYEDGFKQATADYKIEIASQFERNALILEGHREQQAQQLREYSRFNEGLITGLAADLSGIDGRIGDLADDFEVEVGPDCGVSYGTVELFNALGGAGADRPD